MNLVNNIWCYIYFSLTENYEYKQKQIMFLDIFCVFWVVNRKTRLNSHTWCGLIIRFFYTKQWDDARLTVGINTARRTRRFSQTHYSQMQKCIFMQSLLGYNELVQICVRQLQHLGMCLRIHKLASSRDVKISTLNSFRSWNFS